MPVVDVADVVLWGKRIGAVAWDGSRNTGTFEYDRDFQQSGIQPAPLMMPLSSRVYTFPNLAGNTFFGLPGLLSDSLPDRFGNLLIDQWLVRQGRDIDKFSPIERLCYVGRRGMGALEYRPALRTFRGASKPVDIGALVELANKILSEREIFSTRITGDDSIDEETMKDILRVGTSAGGARAKAILAWNDSTGEVRSGQVKAPKGFSYWILKFDGVSGNQDKDLSHPTGYGKIEYAYHLMARDAGIRMSRSRLLHENLRSHFMTRRFDRADDGSKLFMQTLCALKHFDFNLPGAYSYEQSFNTARQLDLPMEDQRQLFLRMVFNVFSRNQDDHTKNISFIMDKQGIWRLSPAYDVIYSFNPKGIWTNMHQMTINGKRNDFTRSDFISVARRFNLGKASWVDDILSNVDNSVDAWSDFAVMAGVSEERIKKIAVNHRRLKHLQI